MRHGARRCLPDVQQLPTMCPQRQDGAMPLTATLDTPQGTFGGIDSSLPPPFLAWSKWKHTARIGRD
jgi:hypothetical protein